MVPLETAYIIAFDPGIATIGWAFIKGTGIGAEAIDYGVIKTPADVCTGDRLLMIEEDVIELINALPHAPDYAALEYFVADRKNTNAGKVLRAEGVIELALAKHGLKGDRLIWLWSSQVKAAIAAYGASKHDIQQATQLVFGLDEIPKPDDAADGLAIGYAASTGNRANVN